MLPILLLPSAVVSIPHRPNNLEYSHKSDMESRASDYTTGNSPVEIALPRVGLFVHNRRMDSAIAVAAHVCGRSTHFLGTRATVRRWVSSPHARFQNNGNTTPSCGEGFFCVRTLLQKEAMLSVVNCSDQ